MTGIGRVSLLPAREQVAAILRQAILLRQFESGYELTLKEAADMVGSSITPVREAFQILFGEGLIELRPNKGAVVLGVNEKSIHDHYELRAVLESYAASEASRPGKDLSSLEETQKISERAIQSGDTTLYQDCNQTFHLSIWKAAGNEQLERTLSSLWNGFSLGLGITEKDYALRSFSEHEEIYAAICAHDSETAKTLMHRHILRSMQDVLTRYQNDSK